MSAPNCFAIATLFLVSSACAQSPAAPVGVRYVLPHGVGKITAGISETWKPKQLNLLDNGTRLVLQLDNDKSSLVASYILFPNDTGSPTAESCRKAVVDSIVDGIRENATVVNQQSSTHRIADGKTVAVASYLIAKAGDVPLQQENVLGFLGDAHTCAEIHISKVNFKPVDQAEIDAVLDSFSFDPAYVPTSADYGLMGTLFFNYIQDYKSAAIYYQRTLDTLPAADLTGPHASVLGRVTVDQLSMSYGLSGDLARSRAVNEAAIARDPTYPLYYYTLACADAEAGDAAAAQKHLQQAFDRRANMLPGEPFPDPAKDDSLLKLKDNKPFWAFVQSLPKS